MWLAWAEKLGVYHGWDAQDRQERGYGKSPLFGWQLALRRLRLGRIMSTPDTSRDGSVASFKGVVPHADFDSGDGEQLDAFCRAVESLLPRLRRLRTAQRTGKAWAAEIRRLVDDFLAVPEDLKADAHVRDRLVRRLDDLAILDGLRSTSGPLPLTLVRELVTECLQKTIGTYGQPLTGGVTIGSLDLLRALPFRVVYIVGLGEELFPGADSRSSLDLRNRKALPGDIRPPETNRFLFLEALLAALDKVYLLYDCRELQRDQELHPSSVISQLRRYLEAHVVADKPFQILKAPLRSSDSQCLAEPAPGAAHDVLVNYSTIDRLVAVADLQARGELELNQEQERQFKAELARYRKDFTPSAPAEEVRGDRIPTVTITELARFLAAPRKQRSGATSGFMTTTSRKRWMMNRSLSAGWRATGCLATPKSVLCSARLAKAWTARSPAGKKTSPRSTMNGGVAVWRRRRLWRRRLPPFHRRPGAPHRGADGVPARASRPRVYRTGSDRPASLPRGPRGRYCRPSSWIRPADPSTCWVCTATSGSMGGRSWSCTFTPAPQRRSARALFAVRC